VPNSYILPIMHCFQNSRVDCRQGYCNNARLPWQYKAAVCLMHRATTWRISQISEAGIQWQRSFCQIIKKCHQREQGWSRIWGCVP